MLRRITRMQSHEAAGLTMPHDWTLDNFSIKTDTEGIMASIHHHTTMMLMSLLAQFLQLSQEGSKGGSHALGADATRFFKLALQAISDYITGIYNRWVIPEIVDYNIATDQYPKLNSTIERVDVVSQSQAIVSMLAAGALTWGDGDEAWFRENNEMGAREEGAVRRLPKFEPGEPATSPAGGTDGN
jgi:hypothetical protein